MDRVKSLSESGQGDASRANRGWVRVLLALAMAGTWWLPPRSVAAQADPCPEPNNGFNNACFIGAAVPTVQGFISQPGDVDAFKFEVNVPVAAVKIELGGLPADYDLHLFSGNAGFVGEAVTPGRGNEVIDLPLIRGNYFLFVNGNPGQADPGRPYTLTVTQAPIGAPPAASCPEPNDVPENACTVTPGRVAFGAIDVPADVDSYRFEVAEPNSRVTVATGDVPADIRIKLLNSSGGSEGETDGASTLVGRVQPGVYVAQLYRTGDDPSPAAYSLLVTLTPPALAPVASDRDPCPEPNDDNDKACPVTLDTPAEGYISNPADIDRYTFEVKGGRSWVHVELSNLPADYDLEVQDSADNSLQASHNGGTFPEAIDIDLDPGTYYVAIYSLGGQGSDDKPYRMTVSMVPADSPQRPRAEILFADNFNGGSSHFTTQSRDGNAYEVGVYDGEYVVKLHRGSSDSSLEADEPAGADLKDFQLDLDARMTALPSESGGFTVSFRWQDDGNTYELYVDPINQAAKILRWVDGKKKDLSDWVKSPAIKPGGQTNHVTIRAQGRNLGAAINGQPLIVVRDDTYSQGDLALGTVTWDRPVEVRFDNVLVTTIR